MAKVSQEVSFTVNLGDYNNAKVVLGIHDIDTEDDWKLIKSIHTI